MNNIICNTFQGFKERHAFIATQSPLENTIADFWLMAYQYGVTTLVTIQSELEVGLLGLCRVGWYKLNVIVNLIHKSNALYCKNLSIKKKEGF